MEITKTRLHRKTALPCKSALHRTAPQAVLHRSVGEVRTEEVEMFLAWRDVLHAKGRFAIITVVVMLMTLLVGFLTGLTGGLAGANVDTVRSWKADRLVMSAPTGAQSASMSTSSISPEAQREWEDQVGQTNVTAIGVTQISASHEENTTGVAIMAHGPGADLGAGTGPNQADDAAAPTGSDVTVSEDAAEELGVQAGSTITVASHEFTVSEVTGTGHYSHVPVVGMSWTAWQELSERTGGSGQPNALLVHADVSDDDAQAINKAANTVSPAGFDQLLAVGSFRSEVGSLGLMIGMLMTISALVVGAFFTVWTLQRTRDIAVMRALGSPLSALLRDAIGQSLLVLAVGVGAGIGIIMLAGPAVSANVPFVSNWLTTLVPGLLMTLLGLIGAAFALRSVTKADPMQALS